MAIQERNGETLYMGTPTDVWPQSVVSDTPMAHQSRVGLEAVAATITSITSTEKSMDLEKTVDAGPSLHRVAWPMLEKAAVTVGQTITAVEAMRGTAEANIASALKPNTPALGPEIRQHIKTSKSPHTEALNAVREGELDIVSAILAAPAAVSGLTRDQQAGIRQLAALQFADAAQKQIEEADKLLAKLKRSSEFLTDYSRRAKARWLPSSAAVNALASLMAEKAHNPEGRPQS